MSELEKMMLKPISSDQNLVSEIKFMFNPTEISFKEQTETTENPGSRMGKSGKPKVSYAHSKPRTITFEKIIFDVYEEPSKDLVKLYIEPFRRALQFVKSSAKANDEHDNRPPLYSLVWGKEIYLECCFVESFSYKFVMFFSDGKPARAVIEGLTLKEADKPKSNQPMHVGKNARQTAKMRKQDRMEARLQAAGASGAVTSERTGGRSLNFSYGNTKVSADMSENSLNSIQVQSDDVDASANF